MRVDPADIVTEPPSLLSGSGDKPKLLCVFCKRSKNLQTIAGYWGHLVHKHDGVDTDQRLTEVRRTGSLWRKYWQEHSNGGKRGYATIKRLEEIDEEGFCWETVMSWKLRG